MSLGVGGDNKISSIVLWGYYLDTLDKGMNSNI